MIAVILDNIRSAYNVGSIFRTCDGAGIDMLYLTGISAYPPHNKIPKTALGAENYIYWEYHKDPLPVIDHLRQGTLKDLSKIAHRKSSVQVHPISDTGKKSKDNSNLSFKIISFELTETSKNLFESKACGNLALIFGHELSGISQNLLEKSDEVVHIPMYGRKKSLNVATSTGIGVYYYKNQLLQNHE